MYLFHILAYLKSEVNTKYKVAIHRINLTVTVFVSGKKSIPVLYRATTCPVIYLVQCFRIERFRQEVMVNKLSQVK